MPYEYECKICVRFLELLQIASSIKIDNDLLLSIAWCFKAISQTRLHCILHVEKMHFLHGLHPTS